MALQAAALGAELRREAALHEALRARLAHWRAASTRQLLFQASGELPRWRPGGGMRVCVAVWRPAWLGEEEDAGGLPPLPGEPEVRSEGFWGGAWALLDEAAEERVAAAKEEEAGTAVRQP